MSRFIIYEDQQEIRSISANNIVSVGANYDAIRFYVNCYEEYYIHMYEYPKNTDMEIIKALVKIITIFIVANEDSNILIINDNFIEKIKNIYKEFSGKDSSGKLTPLNPEFVYDKIYNDEN